MVSRGNTTNLGIKYVVWKNIYYVQAYMYAQQGMSNAQIAKVIGASWSTFSSWVKKRNTLREALDLGRMKNEGCRSLLARSDKSSAAENAGEDISDFENFVFQRLPDDLRKLWIKIHRVQNEPNGIERMEAILEKGGKYARMHLFLYALSTRNFNVSKACRAVNISMRTYSFWMKNEPHFSELLDEMKLHKKMFFEDCLIKLAKKGDSPAIIFGNRTLNRDLGYVDKKELEITGNIQHSHSMVDIESLDLDIETLKKVLYAVRNMRENEKPAAIEYKIDGSVAVPVEDEQIQDIMKETIGKEEEVTYE